MFHLLVVYLKKILQELPVTATVKRDIRGSLQAVILMTLQTVPVAL